LFLYEKGGVTVESLSENHTTLVAAGPIRGLATVRFTAMQETTFSMRVPTGIPGLDEHLRGGFPRGSLILVTGPPGTGKSIFASEFMLQGLQLGNGAVLVDTCHSNEAMIEVAGDFGWDRSLIRKTRLVDCFNFRIGEKTQNTVHIGSFGEVLIMINELLTGSRGPLINGGRLVVDSFSDFVLYNSLESSLRFLQVLRTSLKHHQQDFVSTIILLECGPEDQKIIQSIEYVTDATIRMKADENGRQLMITRMKSTPTDFTWLPFKINSGEGLTLSLLPRGR